MRKYTEDDVLNLLTGNQVETPLEMPTMNFGKDAKKDKLVSNGLEFTDPIRLEEAEEEPLVMPVMGYE
jgi:hypothetical protein